MGQLVLALKLIPSSWKYNFLICKIKKYNGYSYKNIHANSYRK